MKKVLVTDGDQRSALAVTRSLGRHGMQVTVADTKLRSLSCASKYSVYCIEYPSPYLDEKGYIDAIINAIETYGIDMVIPVTDISSVLISKHIEKLPSTVTVCMPPENVYWSASDKIKLHHLADKLGVPHPTRYYVQGIEQYEKIRSNIVFPCIVKPARSIAKKGGNYYKTTVSRVETITQLDKWVKNGEMLDSAFMIQDFIPGKGVGVFALCDHGETLITFSHKRIREKPPTGGVSVLRESIEVDPQMEHIAKQLLKEISWHGVAMVEFRVCDESGVPYLMEINGRLWGSLQLAIDAGVDFPLYLINLYSGVETPISKVYKVGVRSRWLFGDLDHILARIKRYKLYTKELPGIWRTLFDFTLLWKKNMYYEVESVRDPGPFFYEAGSYVKSIVVGGWKMLFGNR